MPPKRTFLFIDGSNTYHRLKENGLYGYFTYGWLYGELSKRFKIDKVFYYDAVKSFNIEPLQYAEQQRFHSKLAAEIPNLVVRHRKLKYIKIDKRVEDAKKTASFCGVCSKKLETFLRDSGLRKLSKEKGVDVLLVADMLKWAFQNKYDAALLLTGDADFVPAAELVQILGKEVVNVHCYAGSAAELRNQCDSHIQIDRDEKFDCVLKYF